MPNVTLYRLRPRGPMHFGARGVGVEGVTPWPSAATVFGAWCWALRDLAGEPALERVLAAARAGDPPFLLAAPLPWIDRVLLLPRPALPPSRAPEAGDDAPRDKRGKRYRWLAEALWFRLVAGVPTGDAFDDDAAFLQDQTIWAPGEEGRLLRERLDALAGAGDDAPPAFWRVATLPHVAVDRHTGAGGIFHASATWFAPGVDLALPVLWRDPAAREALERALALLGDTGLGGERSASYGQFDVVGRETRAWPDLAEAGAFVTLAAYHPTREEVDGGVFDPPASYDFEVSRGWVERSTFQHAVRLVSAGSVLHRAGAGDRYGDLVDVTPEPFRAHRVYRYGYAFPLPVAAEAPGEEEG